jgi:DNA polymerase III alpha subunit (gram-positive type)
MDEENVLPVTEIPDAIPPPKNTKIAPIMRNALRTKKSQDDIEAKELTKDRDAKDLSKEFTKDLTKDLSKDLTKDREDKELTKELAKDREDKARLKALARELEMKELTKELTKEREVKEREKAKVREAKEREAKEREDELTNAIEKFKLEQEHFKRAKQQLEKLHTKLQASESESESEESVDTPPPKSSGKKPVSSVSPVASPPSEQPYICPGCYNCNWTGYATSEPERCILYR